MGSTTPSENKKPLREIVYRDLKKQILSGSLLPGSRLVESTLAEKVKVSRTVIREVIKQLELEGLVRIIPYKGTEVARFSLEDIEEIYTIQAALEGMAAELAAKNMTGAELRELRRLQGQVRNAIRRDPVEWQKMNVLCEAQNYVKLRVWTSAYPLISFPQLSHSLYIIHGPWQAY